MSTDVQDSERVVARLRPHARVLFLPSLALIAAAGGVGYFYGRFTEQWQNIAVLAAAAFVRAHSHAPLDAFGLDCQ